ncbi:MAG: putative transporter, partial [Bacteroidales bacterium]|nr:putative transporter [Bacteroidales bacterium]
MEWIHEIFVEPTFIQAILVLSIICAIGLALGQIKLWGVSLGVTFVFFTGILAGHFGIKINPDMLILAQNFGLVLFIYSLGVQVGPGFFTSFKQGGVKLNVLATSVLVLGTAMALALMPLTGISLPDMMGLLSGAVTNTPMLGAGQQTLLQISPDNINGANRMALACAVGYPMGVIGVILSVIVMKVMFAKKAVSRHTDESIENAFVTEFKVSNPAIFGKSIQELRHSSEMKFVISRVWKDGKVSIPTSGTMIEKGDHILTISSRHDAEMLTTLFGEKADKDWNKKDIDWNSIDSQLVSRHVLVTRPNLNGVKLGSLKLRNSYGINITRVNRAGIDLLASPSLHLQLGDKLTIVGESNAINNVASVLGNEEKQLNNPNLFAIFIGLAVGLIIGSIPFTIPGISTPIKLGLAGGPIIIG